ncbi:hypothetical protein [uncultured Devosia sp.]|uniref:hypothetical protein n=1 Tax=uncultured Devosia sp. TaxID=211434 RepID=UPI00262205C3|nr:hypothetical protein [uncultured Devosia sp.]
MAVSLGTVALGSMAFHKEAGANTVGSGFTGLPQFMSMSAEETVLPLSIQGRRAFLRRCELILQETAPLAFRFATEEQQENAQPLCRSIAEQSVSASPADSYAWLILATAQLRQGDQEAAETSIVRSALTGPNESWLAAARFELVQSAPDAVSDRIRAVADADTAALVPSNRGWVVAREYVTNPAFRERAETIVEAQPEAVQRRFLSLIRRQL